MLPTVQETGSWVLTESGAPGAERPIHLSLKERQWVFFAVDGAAALLVAGAALGAGAEAIAAVAGACVLLAAFVSVELYDVRRRWSRWMLAFRGLKGFVPALWVLWLASLGTGFAFAPAALVAAGAGALAVGWRLAFFPAFTSCPPRLAILVGADERGVAMLEELRAHPHCGYHVVGFVDDDPAVQDRLFGGLPVLGPTERLPWLREALGLDAILIRSLDLPEREPYLACLERGAAVLTFPELYEELSGRIPVSCLDSSWFLAELRHGERRLYAIAKRTIDVAVALAGLAATALLLPAIVLAIKLGGGPGPVLYSQVRTGFRGRPFTIYKFRTMRQDAERGGAVWAREKDDRITRVGAFLRQTRLDELPQFWNVFRGEMTVVGPRPERPEFVSVLAREIPFYAQRHGVAPGLTGWAQVRFPYGASVEDAEQKLQYDLFYIKNRCCYLDFKIMWKTFGVMVQKIGAR